MAPTRAIAKFSPTQKKQNNNAAASKYSSSLQEQPTAVTRPCHQLQALFARPFTGMADLFQILA
jgi:hypothetical protein